MPEYIGLGEKQFVVVWPDEVLSDDDGLPDFFAILVQASGPPMFCGPKGPRKDGKGRGVWPAPTSGGGLAEAAIATAVTGGGALQTALAAMLTTERTTERAAARTLSGARVTKRVLATAGPGATPTINTDNYDVVNLTALATAITSMTTNLTGTPVAGDSLRIAFTDNGIARAITWGASFESSTYTSLPGTTTISTRMDCSFVWNTATSKWRLVGLS